MSDPPDDDPFPVPDWFAALEERWIDTGDPLLLPVEELSDSPELCERLFVDEQEAFNAGIEVGKARRGR